MLRLLLLPNSRTLVYSQFSRTHVTSGGGITALQQRATQSDTSQGLCGIPLINQRTCLFTRDPTIRPNTATAHAVLTTVEDTKVTSLQAFLSLA